MSSWSFGRVDLCCDFYPHHLPICGNRSYSNTSNFTIYKLGAHIDCGTSTHITTSIYCIAYEHRSAGPKSIALQPYLPFSHRYLDDFCVGPLTAPPMSPPHEER
ncbi:uncharacterized protein EAE97_000685 [Botrytis byssoidea]|uniref:Uncharacterized protein n=1 Tax=Botrytis byssoidea TaxID=139641 RepID=A0A9P5IVV1_9HELO|nr:uncharacterized protein EAE97_000685 [Botrytis byssoidea]KAF7955426.1 hypothetical protein EAE97_000685 [Botrytis byssoidea]